MYDPNIGRWLTTDPAGQFASPYEGMGNNPVTGSDPSGGDVTDWVKLGCCSDAFWDPSVNSQADAQAKYGAGALDISGDILLNQEGTYTYFGYTAQNVHVVPFYEPIDPSGFWKSGFSAKGLDDLADGFQCCAGDC